MQTSLNVTKQTPIQLESVIPNADCTSKTPYYRLKIDGQLTIFIEADRLDDIAKLISDARLERIIEESAAATAFAVAQKAHLTKIAEAGE